MNLTPIEQRLFDLGEQRLLPKKHLDFLHDISKTIKPEVIFDIGSCVLHWSREAVNVWPTATYVCFEAMREVAFLYEKYGFRNYFVDSPLSDQDYGQEIFYQNLEHPGGNSLFKENTSMPFEMFIRTTRTLDSVCIQKGFPQPDLIKIDVQGAELKILKGAEIGLSRTKYLILELQHEDYNIGAPKAAEVMNWLENKGFHLQETVCSTNVDADYFFVKK